MTIWLERDQLSQKCLIARR